CLVSFPVSGSVAHRQLHSFPTRRSSDLGHLHRPAAAICLCDGHRIGEVVGPGIAAAAEAATGVEHVDLHLLGLEPEHPGDHVLVDRKSTRLNSSHVKISYAVFCLKKKST